MVDVCRWTPPWCTLPPPQVHSPWYHPSPCSTIFSWRFLSSSSLAFSVPSRSIIYYSDPLFASRAYITSISVPGFSVALSPLSWSTRLPLHIIFQILFRHTLFSHAPPISRRGYTVPSASHSYSLSPACLQIWHELSTCWACVIQTDQLLRLSSSSKPSVKYSFPILHSQRQHLDAF